MPIYVSKGGGGGGADADAIHDNVAGEISAIAEKAAPVAADMLLIEDSAAANAKKRVQLTNLPENGFTEGCYLYMSGVQSIATATGTTLLWDSELYDTDAMHDTGSNTGRITCVTPGKYLFVACIYWPDGGAVGARSTQLAPNGCNGGGRRWEEFGVPNVVYQTAVLIADMSAGDYVVVEVYQNSGGNDDVGATGATLYFSSFAAQRIG